MTWGGERGDSILGRVKGVGWVDGNGWLVARLVGEGCLMLFGPNIYR